MKDDKTYSAVKVRWSPDALLKVSCFVILWEMLISPAKINQISRKGVNTWTRTSSFIRSYLRYMSS